MCAVKETVHPSHLAKLRRTIRFSRPQVPTGFRSLTLDGSRYPSPLSLPPAYSPHIKEPFPGSLESGEAS